MQNEKEVTALSEATILSVCEGEERSRRAITNAIKYFYKIVLRLRRTYTVRLRSGREVSCEN